MIRSFVFEMINTKLEEKKLTPNGKKKKTILVFFSLSILNLKTKKPSIKTMQKNKIKLVGGMD